MKTSTEHLLSFVLPVTVLVIIPALIQQPMTTGNGVWFFAGILLAIAGLALLFATVSIISSIGKGTLAPWSPTQKIVIQGPYAHVRNPMITGVLTTLLGESFLFASISIFLWCILFFLINNVYFSLSEEPDLLKRFGTEYAEYRRHVPRWIPRLRPWSPDAETGSTH
jgi:protein-S-isoprenylcysteine O-methyltransferase Ste14